MCALPLRLFPLLVSCPVGAFVLNARLQSTQRCIAAIRSPRTLSSFGLHMNAKASNRPLETVAIEPSSGTHDSAVIFLHGSGDTGEGVKEWVGGEQGPFAFENTRVIFPTAHMRKYSLLGPHGMQRVWFDRMALGPQGAEDSMGMDAMSELVKQVVYNEVGKGVPLSRIIIGGFSMGGAMSLHTVLADAALAKEKVAGVFAMSTFLADDSVLPGRMEQHMQAGGVVPPVLYCHGEADAMINCKWGETSARRLRKAGAEVEWRTYPGMDHDMCPAELMGVREWILARLAQE